MSPLADEIAIFLGADWEAEAAAADAMPALPIIHLRREKLLIASFYRVQIPRKTTKPCLHGPARRDRPMEQGVKLSPQLNVNPETASQYWLF